LFQPTSESEARVLLLIDGFTTKAASLEGRTKLAKLDFLLRYPKYMNRLLEIRAKDLNETLPSGEVALNPAEVTNIENKMVRYKFGPWDPSYFAILGSLVGKGLVEPVSTRRGVGYRATQTGHEVAKKIAQTDAWITEANRVKLLKKYLNLTGNTLKELIYEHVPEVSSAKWGTKL
jgi:hypothetical protein